MTDEREDRKAGKDEDRKPEGDRKPGTGEDSKGQYGGLEGGIGPGGGTGFEKVERPARPDDDRLPKRDT